MGCLVMGKCKDETTKSISCQEKAKPKSIEHDVNYYHWVMFKHVIEFLRQCTSLKKPPPKHYFTSFMKRLINKRLHRPMWIISNKIIKPQ
jgi:hypothetical protein